MPIFETYENTFSGTLTPFAQTSSGRLLLTRVTVDNSLTVRRKKPVDLWSGGTSRFGYSVRERYFPYDASNSSANWMVHSTTYDSGSINIPTGYVDDSVIISDLAMRIRGLVKDQKVNLALSIKEGAQSISMVNNLCRDAISVYRGLRREGLRSIRRGLGSSSTELQKKLANRWLEYQYGWKPTVSDIYGLAYQASEKARLGVPLFVRTHVGYRDQAEYVQGPRLYKHTWSKSGRAACRYYVANQSQRQLNQLGFTNAAELIWESVPYSFVFDALYDVGTFLHGLDAFDSVYGHSWWYSVKKVGSGSCRSVVADTQPRNAELSYMHYNRPQPNSLVPYGQPLWNNKAPSITRLANYLSLLRQLR